MKDEIVPALTSPQSTDPPYCQRGSLRTGAPLPAEDREVRHRPKHQLLGEGRQGGLTGHTVQAAVHSGLKTVGEQMQRALHASPPWLATREKVHRMAEAPVSGQNQHVNGGLGTLKHRWTPHGCHPPFLGWEGRKKESDSLLQSARMGWKCKYTPQPPWCCRRTPFFANTRHPGGTQVSGLGPKGRDGCHRSHRPPLRPLFGPRWRHLPTMKFPTDEWWVSDLSPSTGPFPKREASLTT